MGHLARQAHRQSRRRFLQCGLAFASLSLVSGCSIVLPGSRPAKSHRIGFLAVGTRDGRAPLIDAFLEGLDDLGYVENQTFTIEYRFSDGQDQRLPALATELVALKVDAILASGTLAALAAQRATNSVPIVMGAVADPVGTGLVASLALPGGNVTGISTQSPETAGKRLEVLKETLPGLTRLAVLLNETSPASAILRREIEGSARLLGVTVHGLPVRTAGDLEGAIDAARAAGDQAVYPASDPLFVNARAQLAALALRYQLPLMGDFREQVEAGGLLAYGPVFAAIYRRAAAYVDKILKGARPADLPVEQPTNFELFVNVNTARALGLSIPPAVLQQATEAIE